MKVPYLQTLAAGDSEHTCSIFSFLETMSCGLIIMLVWLVVSSLYLLLCVHACMHAFVRACMCRIS